MKRILLFPLLITIIFLAVWLHFLFTPIVSNPAGLRYQLHPGTSLKAFTLSLSQQGIIKQPYFLILLARWRGSEHALKSGVYLIPQGSTPGQLLDQVTTGKGLLYRVFTIIPGWTFQQLRNALDREVYLQHTLPNLKECDLMKLLGSTVASPEGEFYPDTYYYVEGTADTKLLSRAYKRLQDKLLNLWLTRDPNSIFKTPYEALIAASLIEKETSLNSEQAVIAGVLINRLQKNMLLQFDPTVEYSLNQSGVNRVITKQDLQLNTPYNTYIHKGLPPTPIAFPGGDAINAVLHPIAHSYLYFVATGSGGHRFSKTLAEHHIAVLMMHTHDQGFFNYALIQHYLIKQFSNG